MTDEVRQEDREAAAEWYRSQFESDDVIASFKAGKLDWHPTPQAFARHASSLRDRIAVLEGALKACAEAPHSGWTIAQALARDVLMKERG